MFFFLLIAAAVGFYLYKTNYFTEIQARFDYTPEGVSVTPRDSDLHDCELNLTHDYAIDLPFLRQGATVSIPKTDFRQWNGTILESMDALGPEIKFHLRCREGAVETKDSNRYYDR